jgi:6-phosphofructokinase 1
MSKRVGILVGGGDVPGLNMCLKSLIYRVIDEGFEPIGIRKGWEGLIKYDYHDPTTYGDNFIELNKPMIRAIDRMPGSFLHSSRVNPLEVSRQFLPAFLRGTGANIPDGPQDVTDHIKEVIDRLGYRGLIVVGDDDALRYAAHLSRAGVPIIAIPKTIHNNIYGTDYTVGFSTGLARGVAFIHELRSLAGSREEILVVETFRINSGLSTLMVGFLAGVDRVIIPEVPYDPELLASLVQRDKALHPNNYAVVLVSDGSRIVPEKILKYTPHLSPRSKSEVLQLMTEERARETEAEGEFTLDEVVETGSSLAGSGMVVAELLRHLLDEEVFLQTLTYLLRTGSPDGQDLLGATNFAILAGRLLREGKFGRMTAYQRRYNLTDVDLDIVTQGVNGVVIDEMYDVDRYKPKVNLIWAADDAE